MFSRIVMFLSLMAVSTSAQAKSWSVSVPTWVSSLVATVTELEGEIERRTNATCLGLGVYYESRGEPVRGQRAVASVINNRVKDPRWPDTACEVLFQPKQFSFTNGRRELKPFGPSWSQAIAIGNEFADGKTENRYLYFSSERNLKGHRIGNHVFR